MIEPCPWGVCELLLITAGTGVVSLLLTENCSTDSFTLCNGLLSIDALLSVATSTDPSLAIVPCEEIFVEVAIDPRPFNTLFAGGAMTVTDAGVTTPFRDMTGIDRDEELATGVDVLLPTEDTDDDDETGVRDGVVAVRRGVVVGVTVAEFVGVVTGLPRPALGARD